MCDEDARLAGEHALDGVLEECLAHVSVDGREGVVEEVNVGLGVEGTGECHALGHDERRTRQSNKSEGKEGRERRDLLLTTREVDALLADLGRIAAREHGKVGAQFANLHNFLVAELE